MLLHSDVGRREVGRERSKGVVVNTPGKEATRLRREERMLTAVGGLSTCAKYSNLHGAVALASPRYRAKCDLGHRRFRSPFGSFSVNRWG